MIILTIILTIIFLILLILSQIYINGLRGGFGKGTWSEDSWYMQNAIQTRNVLIILNMILFLIDYLIFKN